MYNYVYVFVMHIISWDIHIDIMLFECGGNSCDCGHTKIHAVYTTNVSCEYIQVCIKWYICGENLRDCIHTKIHINSTTIFLRECFHTKTTWLLQRENSHS